MRTEVAGLLENVLPSAKNPWAVEQAYVLYYTGCRLEELNGLLVRDFDFQDQHVHFIENEVRDFKTFAGKRVTPVWPRRSLSPANATSRSVWHHDQHRAHDHQRHDERVQPGAD
ncbi:MAG: hypothetical protein LH467_10470 [Gemmatimonadaceae bacterium]|nr:hypothetical protein [Gemmatimonadaceae bacterium]